MAFNPNPTQEPANSTIGGGQGFNGSTTEGAVQNDPGTVVEDWGGSLSSDPMTLDEFAGILESASMLERDGRYGKNETLYMNFVDVRPMRVTGDEEFIDEDFTVRVRRNVRDGRNKINPNSVMGMLLKSGVKVFNCAPNMPALQVALDDASITMKFIQMSCRRGVMFGSQATDVWEFVAMDADPENLVPTTKRTSPAQGGFSPSLTGTHASELHLNGNNLEVARKLWDDLTVSAKEGGYKATITTMRQLIVQSPDEVYGKSDWRNAAKLSKENPQSLWAKMVKAGIITD